MCSLPSHLYRPPLQTVDSSGYNDKNKNKLTVNLNYP
jgi:hypothetical protein